MLSQLAPRWHRRPHPLLATIYISHSAFRPMSRPIHRLAAVFTMRALLISRSGRDMGSHSTPTTPIPTHWITPPTSSSQPPQPPPRPGHPTNPPGLGELRLGRSATGPPFPDLSNS